MIQPLRDQVLIQRIEEEELCTFQCTSLGRICGHPKSVHTYDSSCDECDCSYFQTPIILTDAPKGIKGVILAIGPGKWVPGEWWKVRNAWISSADGIQNPVWGEWEWFPGHRQPMQVKPGMSVLFNSKWNDLSAGENVGTGADLSGPLERPLPLEADPMIHLVQEADIFCIIPDLNVKARLLPPLLEREHMQIREIAGPWSDPANG
jgi:hypothetical protein